METYKDSDAGKEILKNKVIQLGMEFTDVVINKLVDFFGCENYWIYTSVSVKGSWIVEIRKR